MKNTTLSLLAAAMLAASSMALAQTIAAPAGSMDSGARAQIGIVPVDTSNLATKTDVNNANNYSASLYNASINYTNAVKGQPVYGQVMAVTSANYSMDGGTYQVPGLCLYGYPNHPSAWGYSCPGGSGYQPTAPWYRYTPA